MVQWKPQRVQLHPVHPPGYGPDHWSAAGSQKSAVNSWRSEVSGQQLAVRSQRSTAGGLRSSLVSRGQWPGIRIGKSEQSHTPSVWSIIRQLQMSLSVVTGDVLRCSPPLLKQGPGQPSPGLSPVQPRLCREPWPTPTISAARITVYRSVPQASATTNAFIN